MKSKVNPETGEVAVESGGPFLRHAYSNHEAYSDSFGLECADESLASQSSKDEADINTLVRRFGLAGELPTGVRAPTFGDFTGLGSYQEALNALLEAQGSFMALPADVRMRFENDPHRFVAFCSDDANYDQICDMGLLAPDAMQKRVEARRASEKAELDRQVQAEIQRRQQASGEAGHS